MSRTVLAIGAHIGDMDLTAGPTLAKLVLDGANVTIVALTAGERGHPRLPPAEYKQQKVAEGEAFATAIGADFMVLGHRDGFLPDTDEAAAELATVIRETQPDTLITHWKHSTHRDHSRTAALVDRARFLADFPITPADALGTLHDLPRHAVRTLLHTENWQDMDGFHPTHYVPIPDEAFYRWISAIRHQAFARGETQGFRHIDYYTALMTTRGCLSAYPRANAFHQPPTPETTKLAGP
ncbi:PIG-L family deacetylase [Kribbella sandramycini]|uniref:LmbE family N-acetylglucosaminyl deacetylase n=1 Tax=Kribbella sandramycini TaxID=60450 RepID=A0A7Y4L5Z9_9ACTN|nr:PIG-L family deacetylase [Kribbella sandramycini]MBB6570792.1 LmbE family N-acetylglucosaminyl deacetylase [Kribbella sandramycini]NOL43931.1 PIG-L family deacetylase [Kribbella sandramycini]